MDTLTQMREELVAAYAPGGRLHLSPGHPTSISLNNGRGPKHIRKGPSRRTLNKRQAKRNRS